MGSSKDAREIQDADALKRRSFRVGLVDGSGHVNIISRRHEITQMRFVES
jgi:hypothetical protein